MEEMTLRCPVAIKAKVTETLKNNIIADLKERLDMVEQDLNNFDFQANRLLSEQAQQDVQGLTALRAHVEEEKQKRIDFKAEVAAKLKEAEKLEIGAEISQGTMERTVTVKMGDDLSKIMGTEILLEDGKIVAFRQ